MKVKNVLVTIALIVAVPIWGCSLRPIAAEPPTLSLEAIQREALENNRDLRAARFLVREAQGRLEQSGVWPNPEVELQGANDRLFENDGEYRLSSALIQKFPIAARLSRATAAAAVDVERARAEIKNRERLLLAEVLGNARAFQSLQQERRFIQSAQGDIRKLIAISEGRLARAEVSQTDVNSEKIELQKLELQESALEVELDRLRASLRSLMGNATPDQFDVNNMVTVPGYHQNDLVLETVLAKRPDLTLAKLNIEYATAETRLFEAERFEDWSIGIGYDREFDRPQGTAGTDKSDFLGARLTIPLPLWNAQRGRIAESVAARSRAEAQYAALVATITEELNTARSKVDRLAPLLERYERESLFLAQQNLTTLFQGYRDGLVPISGVFQAQQQLYDIRKNYAATQRELLQANTDLQTAAGSNPLLWQSDGGTYE